MIFKSTKLGGKKYMYRSSGSDYTYLDLSFRNNSRWRIIHCLTFSLSRFVRIKNTKGIAFLNYYYYWWKPGTATCTFLRIVRNVLCKKSFLPECTHHTIKPHPRELLLWVAAKRPRSWCRRWINKAMAFAATLLYTLHGSADELYWSKGQIWDWPSWFHDWNWTLSSS